MADDNKDKQGGGRGDGQDGGGKQGGDFRRLSSSVRLLRLSLAVYERAPEIRKQF